MLVRSSPAGATVEVNGTPRGVTPLVVRDLPFETYSVEVERAGYAPEIRTLAVSADRPAASVTVELVPVGGAAPEPWRIPATTPTPPPTETVAGSGSLYVRSDPRGVRVWLDDVMIGTAPFLISAVDAGVRAIRLEHEGYRPLRTEVRVTAGERANLTATLEPEP